MKGQEQIFQAMCSSCHTEKTALESKQDCRITNLFNKKAFDEYAQSPRLPPLVFEIHSSERDKPYVGIDCVRCRKNGLANAKYDFPI